MSFAWIGAVVRHPFGAQIERVRGCQGDLETVLSHLNHYDPAQEDDQSDKRHQGQIPFEPLMCFTHPAWFLKLHKCVFERISP